MKELDFTIEFSSENIKGRLESELFDEANRRLRALAAGHDDLRGAAINLRQPAHGETPYLFEAAVVAYARPEDIAASEKHQEPLNALKGALSAIERQVRQKRDKMGEPWKRPGKGRVETEIVETSLSSDPERLEAEESD
jgi:ribosome-associated translation inhibitor RaiA